MLNNNMHFGKYSLMLFYLQGKSVDSQPYQSGMEELSISSSQPRSCLFQASPSLCNYHGVVLEMFSSSSQGDL